MFKTISQAIKLTANNHRSVEAKEALITLKSFLALAFSNNPAFNLDQFLSDCLPDNNQFRDNTRA